MNVHPIQRNAILLSGLLLLAFSCTQNKSETKEKPVKEIEVEALQSIVDAAQVEGAILVFNPAENTYYSNNFTAANTSVIPASTYKIPHSIIGLETGILENEESIFKWDGNERGLDIWEKDLTLREALQRSCVPCYQGLARKIGVERMNKHLSILHFGEMDVKEDNLDNFWLLGASKINPFQQIDFLKRLYNNELAIAPSTNSIVKNIIKMEEKEAYTLSGKTGLGLNPKGNVGWFVGYVEKENQVYYFATRITQMDDDNPMNGFAASRKEITMAALKKLKVMK